MDIIPPVESAVVKQQGSRKRESKYSPATNGVKPYEWNNAKPESRQERRRRERGE